MTVTWRYMNEPCRRLGSGGHACVEKLICPCLLMKKMKQSAWDAGEILADRVVDRAPGGLSRTKGRTVLFVSWTVLYTKTDPV